jgi:DUF1680 family protein
MTRRDFVATAIAATGGVGAVEAARELQPVVDKAEKKARTFSLRQTRVLDSPLFYFMERNRGYLHSLEEDRLLHNFRRQAGLASSAQPLGGWESPEIELRGHFVGHYLSGCALMSISARDELIKQKANRIVTELGKCQRTNGGGYLSAFPAEFFERLKTGQKVWAPWYTIHKILAGMLDMYVHTGNQQAMDIAQGMANWTKKWVDGVTDAQMAEIQKVEFGGMNEVLYNLYAATGDSVYFELAHRFDHQSFFDPLATGRDELKGLHANTHIPKVIGAARRYELTGDDRYRRIAEFFWRQVTAHRAYCSGGTSNEEGWRTDPDQLASELSATTHECCCTYNLLKLTRHLFSWTADPSGAEYYERALFNGILGTMNPKDGMTMYYVPMASGYWKMFSHPRASFWCCTGTGLESFAKLTDSIYFHDDSGLYVNLFIPSQLEWPEKGLRLRQETRFPEQERTQLIVSTDMPVDLNIRIRVPQWAAGVSAAVNGEPVASPPPPGNFWAIHRVWKNGDRLDLRTPMTLHVHAMPDDPTLQAFLYGPVVLAGKLGRQGLTYDQMYGNPKDAMNNYYLQGNAVPVPDFRPPSPDPDEWIKPVADQPLTFRTTGQAQNVTLVPLNQLFEERYAIYWRVKA